MLPTYPDQKNACGKGEKEGQKVKQSYGKEEKKDQKVNYMEEGKRSTKMLNKHMKKGS